MSSMKGAIKPVSNASHCPLLKGMSHPLSQSTHPSFFLCPVLRQQHYLLPPCPHPGLNISPQLPLPQIPPIRPFNYPNFPSDKAILRQLITPLCTIISLSRSTPREKPMPEGKSRTKESNTTEDNNMPLPTCLPCSSNEEWLSPMPGGLSRHYLAKGSNISLRLQYLRTQSLLRFSRLASLQKRAIRRETQTQWERRMEQSDQRTALTEN